MRSGSANIRSPEVLRRLRHRYIEFDERARAALELASRDVSAVNEWLHREQLPYWRRQQRRLEDLAKQTRRNYLNARYRDPRSGGKPSAIDERKAWEKAVRMQREAEQTLARVEYWVATLEHTAGKLLPPIKRLESLLDNLSPKAVARLDHMLDRLEEYLLPSSGGRPAKETTDASNQSVGTDPDGSSE